jgi:ferredoxin
MDAYQLLARQLDALPNGFPPTPGGLELRLLAKMFTPEEAMLASQLSPQLESVEQIAGRTGRDIKELRGALKDLAKRGLISMGRVEGGFGYSLMPFVVGIYENQVGRLDAEMAQLFEDYYRHGFGQVLSVAPQVHRVIPIGETVKNTMEVQPYESASTLVDAMQSWGVLDCICRKQKALIGEPCGHPLDVCMAFSERPGAFDGNPVIRALTREEAQATLRRAADAGLVHSVSNNQQGIHYICNCCTCSCGILRGMADLGIANVVARSAFVNTVDDLLCNACGTCADACPFDAISVDMVAEVKEVRCVGCGVCVLVCPSEALSLVRRPEADILPVPESIDDWGEQRISARGI